MGGWGIWVDVPVKTLRGHGENSLHRRYETPQMYVSLALYSDSPISTKKTLSMESERSSKGQYPRDIRVFLQTNIYKGFVGVLLNTLCISYGCIHGRGIVWFKMK